MITVTILPGGFDDLIIRVEERSGRENLWTQESVVRGDIPLREAVKMSMRRFTSGLANHLADDWWAQSRRY